MNIGDEGVALLSSALTELHKLIDLELNRFFNGIHDLGVQCIF